MATRPGHVVISAPCLLRPDAVSHPCPCLLPRSAQHIPQANNAAKARCSSKATPVRRAWGAPGLLQLPDCPRSCWARSLRSRPAARGRAPPAAPAPQQLPLTGLTPAQSRMCCRARPPVRLPAERYPPAALHLCYKGTEPSSLTPCKYRSARKHSNQTALPPARSVRPASTKAPMRFAFRLRIPETKLLWSEVERNTGQPTVLKKEHSIPSPLPSPTRCRS